MGGGEVCMCFQNFDYILVNKNKRTLKMSFGRGGEP